MAKDPHRSKEKLKMPASDGKNEITLVARSVARLSEYFSGIANPVERQGKLYLHGFGAGAFGGLLVVAAARHDLPMAATIGAGLIAIYAIPAIWWKYSQKNNCGQDRSIPDQTPKP